MPSNPLAVALRITVTGLLPPMALPLSELASGSYRAASINAGRTHPCTSLTGQKLAHRRPPVSGARPGLVSKLPRKEIMNVYRKFLIATAVAAASLIWLSRTR